MNVSREEAIRVPCPECMAAIGYPCVGSRGQERTACHQGRHNHAARNPVPQRERRAYDVSATIGDPNCKTCEGVGFKITELPDRYGPCHCRT